MRIALVALCLSLACQEETAEQFMKKVVEKYLKAKSVGWSGAGEMKAGGKTEGSIKYSVLFKGDKYKLDATFEEGRADSHTEVCDGKTISDLEIVRKAPDKAAADLLTALLRQGAIVALMTRVFEPGTQEVAISDLKLEKNEKINGRDARVVSFTATVGERTALSQTLWFDAETLALVQGKAEVKNEFELVETISGFAFDAEVPDGAFEPPKPVVDEAAVVRFALEYYAMWNGGFPKSLDALVGMPRNNINVPDGGFLESVPKLEYDGKKLAGKQLVLRVGPIPEFRRLTTQWRLTQARLLVNAYATKNGKLPATLKEAGAPTKDGWGAEFVYTSDGNAARISSKGPQSPSALTKEQSEKLAKLAAVLGGESLDDRDKAEKELLTMGEDAVASLRALAEKATDKEAKARLEGVANRIAAIAASSGAPLDVHAFLTRLAGKGVTANERNASGTLRTFSTAQADFRSNDRDDNRINDFWVGDVAQLHYMKVGDYEIKLIEPKAAEADAAAISGKLPKPGWGYLFRVVPFYNDGLGIRPYAAEEAKMRHPGKYAFVAYPADYGVTGRMTYIVDESITMWQKDTMGEAVMTFPVEPRKDGWRKLD